MDDNPRIVVFTISEWNRDRFNNRIIALVEKDKCELIGKGTTKDPFNGRTKYQAKFRKKVEY